jgi:plasmid stabilization system protein ParE
MNTYSVAVSDPADADLDRIFLRLVVISMEDALTWEAGYKAALESLTSLPNRCPKARDGDRYPGVVVRQLYFGKYRLIFYVIEADTDEMEGTVIILRVLYGAQSLKQTRRDEE